jgi:antitoxin component YwqK of YwqJK toxin-antitoxin module
MISENIVYHDNGNIKCHYPSLDGFYHGVQRWWFKNGQIAEEYIQVLGLREGFNEKWFEDGTRLAIKKDKKDSQFGPEIVFKYGN